MVEMMLHFKVVGTCSPFLPTNAMRLDTRVATNGRYKNVKRPSAPTASIKVVVQLGDNVAVAEVSVNEFRCSVRCLFRVLGPRASQTWPILASYLP
jgi:hypothetical protein